MDHEKGDTNNSGTLKHLKYENSRDKLGYFAKGNIPIGKTYTGIAQTLHSFVLGIPMQVTFSTGNLAVIRCIYHCPRCFVHWIKSGRVTLNCTRAGDLTPGPEHKVKVFELKRIFKSTRRHIFARENVKDSMRKCIQFLINDIGNTVNENGESRKSFTAPPEKSGVVGLRKTNGDFFPGYFHFGDNFTGKNYSNVIFKPLSVIDDDGCPHEVTNNLRDSLPTLADFLNSESNASKFKFCTQDGTKIDVNLLTQGLVYNSGENGTYFFTQTYDQDKKDFNVVCVFTNNGILLPGTIDNEGRFCPTNSEKLKFDCNIPQLPPKYYKKEEDTKMEAGSVFIGGDMGPNERYYPYGKYNDKGQFEQGSSSISSFRFCEIYFPQRTCDSIRSESRSELCTTSAVFGGAISPSSGPLFQNKQLSETQSGSTISSFAARSNEGLGRRPSVVFIQEMDAASSENLSSLKTSSSKQLNVLNPAVKNRTGKPNTKAGPLSDGSRKSQPFFNKEQIPAEKLETQRNTDLSSIYTNQDRRPSTRASQQLGRRSTIDINRTSTKNLSQRRSSVLDTNAKRPVGESRRNLATADNESKTPAGSTATPATFARQREIEKKMRKEKDEVKAKYQNAAHHSMLSSEAAETLLLGGTKTSRSTLGQAPSVDQNIGQSQRLPVIRQTTASGDRKKIRRKTSTLPKTKKTVGAEDSLDDLLADEPKEVIPEIDPDDGILTQEALGAMFLSDDEDADFDLSDLSGLSSDEEDGKSKISNKSHFFPFIDGLSNLSFTKNFKFSYFIVPDHVREHNDKIRKGVLKLPAIPVSFLKKSKQGSEKRPPKGKGNKKTQLMKRIEKLNQNPV